MADAACLSLLFAAPLWFFVIKPLSNEYQREKSEPRIAPLALLVKALAIVFFAQFLVMMALPYLFPHTGRENLALADSCMTVLATAPPIWWLFFRRKIRNRIVPLSDL